MMEPIILQYAPQTWDKTVTSTSQQFRLSSKSDEFRCIFKDLVNATSKEFMVSSLQSIERVQNLYDFGQFLIREQLKADLQRSITFYRVRRFIKIKTQYLKKALEYNLDYRRCNINVINFRFSRRLTNVQPDESILVVKVLSVEPLADAIKPDTSSDYFIEYIINLRKQIIEPRFNHY